MKGRREQQGGEISCGTKSGENPRRSGALFELSELCAQVVHSSTFFYKWKKKKVKHSCLARRQNELNVSNKQIKIKIINKIGGY